MAAEQKTGRAKKQIKYKMTVDYIMIVLIMLLVCIGLIMVYSASYYTAELRQSAGTSDFYFAKQLTCAGLGTVAMVFLMFFDYHHFIEFPWKGKFLKKVPPYAIILAIALLCLVCVFVPGIGRTEHGSSRWLNIAGLSIQPSELVKVGLIIFLSCAIGKNPERLRKPLGFGLYILLWVAICAVIYMQPNFSAIICITVMFMIMLYVGGAHLGFMGIVVAVGVVALALLVTQAGYRSERLEAMTDPMGNYHVRQGLISIGSGGLFGRGLGNSMQKLKYLPFSESDYIFAIIAEELGLVGAAGVLAVYGLLIWRGTIAAMRAPDLTGMLMATGVVSILTIQVVVNVGVVVNLIPPTGVVLPFISYGGSGLIIFMAMMGLLLNVSRQSRKETPPVADLEEHRRRREQEKAPQRKYDRRRAR